MAEGRRPDGLPAAGHLDPFEDLPFAVELWDLAHVHVERVLGRASSAALAQAIYAAAQTEHLGRRITLRHGDRTIAARN